MIIAVTMIVMLPFPWLAGAWPPTRICSFAKGSIAAVGMAPPDCSAAPSAATAAPMLPSFGPLSPLTRPTAVMTESSENKMSTKMMVVMTEVSVGFTLVLFE